MPRSRKGMKSRNGKKPVCNFCDCGDHAWSPLSDWRVTLVSAVDAEWLKGGHWSTGHRGYAFRVHPTLGAVRLNRVILNPPPGLIPDHRSRNNTDNRRENLRIATPQQNATNTRKKRKGPEAKGVRQRESGRWQARIGIGRRLITIGVFDTEQEAAAAYDAAAISLHGEFAATNSDLSNTARRIAA